MSLPTLSLFLQIQIWRIKHGLNPTPIHVQGPKKPSMSDQEGE